MPPLQRLHLLGFRGVGQGARQRRAWAVAGGSGRATAQHAPLSPSHRWPPSLFAACCTLLCPLWIAKPSASPHPWHTRQPFDLTDYSHAVKIA